MVPSAVGSLAAAPGRSRRRARSARTVRSRLERLLRARILDPETQEDDVLWKQVSKNLPDDPHLPLLLAQAWGIVPEHYNFWLARAEYEEGDAWSSAFAEEIDTLAARSSSAGLKPLSGLFLSIDSASTRDIDDAFDIAPRAEGGWTVDVVLACPALVWPFGRRWTGPWRGAPPASICPRAIRT